MSTDTPYPQNNPTPGYTPPEGVSPYGAPQVPPVASSLDLPPIAPPAPQAAPNVPTTASFNVSAQPQWGTPPPVTGVPTPAYGQSSPAPQATPGYGTLPPAYGQAPAYGSQVPVYPSSTPGQLASWIQRVLAGLVDYGLPSLIGGTIAGIGAVLAGGGSGVIAAIGALLTFVGYVVAFGFIVWNSWIVQGKTGQTIGKKWQKLRLISEDTGQIPGTGPTILRYILHTVDGAACSAGFFAPLFTPKKQTFSDMIMKTLVVTE